MEINIEQVNKISTWLRQRTSQLTKAMHVREQTCRKIYFSPAKPAAHPRSSRLANTQKLSCKSRSPNRSRFPATSAARRRRIPRKFHSFFLPAASPDLGILVGCAGPRRRWGIRSLFSAALHRII